jgi:Zn finger protein HypA/HybF involved in hydrogenase expression
MVGAIRMEAYCLKCRTKREMKNEQQITMKNGKPATQGICPVCGTKMFKIGTGEAKAAAGKASAGARASQ